LWDIAFRLPARVVARAAAKGQIHPVHRFKRPQPLAAGNSWREDFGYSRDGLNGY
jgi:hypothetical protein